jgi:hypothetical protein
METALLLDGSHTTHSTFKNHFEVNEHFICSTNKNSINVTMLSEAFLIIWNEVPMQH